MPYLVPVVFALCLAALPAGAWAQTGLGPQVASAADGLARVALIPGWRADDGLQVAAIDITLAPGWHTYWRDPGDSGIPPDFDWSGSRNLASVRYQWPSPRIFELGAERTFGYEDRLVLTVILTPQLQGAPMDAALDLFFGVCAQICIPAQAHVTAQLTGARDPQGAALIARADEMRIRSAAEAGVTGMTCKLEPDGDGYRLTTEVGFAHPPGANQTAIVEAGNPDLWAGPSTSETSGRRVVSRTPLDAQGAGPVPMLDRSALRVTLIGPDNAVEITGCRSPN